MENSTDKAVTPETDNGLADRSTIPAESEQPELAGVGDVDDEDPADGSSDEPKEEDEEEDEDEDEDEDEEEEKRKDEKPDDEGAKVGGPQRHSHGPNFGRYVAGCSRCEFIRERKQLADAVIGKRIPPTPYRDIPQAPPMVTITVEQLQAIMAGQASAQTEALKQFAAELRKPDPEEQERRDAAKLRAAQRKANRIIEITAEENSKIARWEACEAYGHKKENAKSAVNIGQIHADGMHHPFCQRCFKVFPAVRPAAGSFSGAASS